MEGVKTRHDDWRSLRARNEARCLRILDAAAPLEVTAIDWRSSTAAELNDAVVSTLVYMRDVEGFTDRDLVGLTAHRNTVGDPVLARFLKVWRAEEAGHAAVIGEFLRWYAAETGVSIPDRQLPPPAVVRCV